MTKLIIYDLDDTLFDSTGQRQENDEQLSAILPFNKVNEVLSMPGSIKTLVTVGDKELQRQKIEIMGLRDYFTDILYCEKNEDKGEAFRALAKKHNASGSDVIVVGNRIDCEIEHGNRLGFDTVLVKWGKYEGLTPANEHQHPHYSVSEFEKLLELEVLQNG